MKLRLAIALMTLASPGWSADCQSIYGTPWDSITDFRSRPFGTLGFLWNDETRVFVPDPGTSCIAMPRNGPRLHFIFNHRSDERETGYVSFKLYGFDGPWKVWTRLLQRKGPWQRGGKDLPDPWKKLDARKPSPFLISDYEAFYKGDAAEAAFDAKFGVMHAKPKGSDHDSWDDLTAMQPETDLPRLQYLAHSLQRVEAGPAVANNPPDYFTERFEYQTLVMHVFSPIGDGPSSTIVFKFNG
jgi:hypothetical protein